MRLTLKKKGVIPDMKVGDYWVLSSLMLVMHVCSMFLHFFLGTEFLTTELALETV